MLDMIASFKAYNKTVIVFCLACGGCLFPPVLFSQSDDAGKKNLSCLIMHEVTLPVYTNGVKDWLGVSCELLKGESPDVVTRITLFAEGTPAGINCMSNSVVSTGGFSIKRMFNVECPNPECKNRASYEVVSRIRAEGRLIRFGSKETWKSRGLIFEEYYASVMLVFISEDGTTQRAPDIQNVRIVLSYAPPSKDAVEE